MKPSEALALHRNEVLRILDAAGALNPRVFGSVARGEDTEGSDLDLWIDAPPGFTLFNLGRLIADFEALLGVPVDIGTGFRATHIEDADQAGSAAVLALAFFGLVAWVVHKLAK
ncbi:nucleotidyltransferase domain-containing protein (plasmid) [Cupriavidus necator]|uniref:Nucleotidyltransferase n=1 Tax=Cupriavidus necator TaxID=106590 RepID=A0A367P914_CUPNE|nr:nucleotidyltransferase domain-containing protein [Cupriavidus necator]QQX89666.1 nucleotidyltransferase domain-containing protein [Cupriavidus necator]RCJ03717.1 nucleotidyltransferase [Cupriavidus necator]